MKDTGPYQVAPLVTFAQADLVEQFSAFPPPACIYVMGAPDWGKTTLCRYLAARLAWRQRAAYLDADPGQSLLGPPGTIGLAMGEPGAAPPLALWFVGSNSPARRIDSMLEGLAALSARARAAGARTLIVDSCGYTLDAGGTTFQLRSLERLQPDHIVALQIAFEVEPILGSPGIGARARIHRLTALPVRRRSMAQRAAYRSERFRRYFADAAPVELELSHLSVVDDLPEPADFCFRLAALCDAQGFVVVLAIAQSLDLTTGRLRCLAPPCDPARVVSVRVGTLRVDPATGEDEETMNAER